MNDTATKPIDIDAVSQYGLTRYYVHDGELAQTLQTLTGTLTLSMAQIDALKALGLTVGIFPALRKPR
jgi:hypothetical protein